MHTRDMLSRPNGKAPTRAEFELGAKGGLTAMAWQYVWDRLSSTEWTNAGEIAEEAGKKFHILPQSIRTQMYAAVRDGHLESELRQMDKKAFRNGKEFTTKRKVTFYRIKAAERAA